MGPIFNYEVNRHKAPKPHDKHACKMKYYYATGFMYSIYKIGARERGHTLGFDDLGPGFGVGLRVQGSTGSRFGLRDRSQITGVDLGVPGSRTWFGVGGASVSPWSMSFLSS